MEIYKLVYQHSHTHPIPNTPNSSLTNTSNRENLASCSKLENSYNIMQQPNSLFHSTILSILCFFPSLQLLQHLSLYRIFKSAKMSPSSNRIVLHATSLFPRARYYSKQRQITLSRTLYLKYIYFATILNQSIYIEHVRSKTSIPSWTWISKASEDEISSNPIFHKPKR